MIKFHIISNGQRCRNGVWFIAILTSVIVNVQYIKYHVAVVVVVVIWQQQQVAYLAGVTFR